MKTVRIALVLLGASLAGCAPAGLAGLAPINPPWPGYPSVHPELQWEPLTAGERDPRFTIEDVRYDLRVYDGRSMIYSVEGLTAPRHRIDMDLRRDTDYWWTVRARFRLNGAPRRTDWIQSDEFRNREARIAPVVDRYVPLKIGPRN
jgi:hypothetical protein